MVRARKSADTSKWLTVPESYRALVVRNRVDEAWVAIDQQHERVVAHSRHALDVGLLAVAPVDRARLKADMRYFFADLRHMLRVCELARRSDLTGAESLRLPIRLYAARIEPVISLRDAQEHIDEATVEGRSGLACALQTDRVLITHQASTPYDMRHLVESTPHDTRHLLDAAQEIHRRIRAVTDPLAVAEVHYHPPFVDLPVQPTSAEAVAV